MVNCIHFGEFKGETKVYCANGDQEYRPYYACSIHHRCIPKISGKASMVWNQREESKHFKWCHTCVDKMPISETGR